MTAGPRCAGCRGVQYAHQFGRPAVVTHSDTLPPMNARGHRQFAFLLGTGSTLALGTPGWQALMVGSLATLTAGGRLSPDIDQTRFYRAMLPKRLEGHRKLSHYWGWPVLAAGLLAVYTFFDHPWWAMLAAALILGWASHLIADFVFGAASRYRPAGIPFAPLTKQRGLFGRKYGLHSAGRTARLCERLVFPVSICAVVALSIARWGAQS